ncbi:hypothetical protein L798_12267 [Zootermopsis nevadensis]|uniref:Uncharacterized protein n=1 Tax=Zootermopsis nevadensis TaxID=136037 RepID=A0A067QWH2_ZOONE|nr:hypothetical protein L798_12267 [Zootermopsis nevadensis]
MRDKYKTNLLSPSEHKLYVTEVRKHRTHWTKRTLTHYNFSVTRMKATLTNWNITQKCFGQMTAYFVANEGHWESCTYGRSKYPRRVSSGRRKGELRHVRSRRTCAGAPSIFYCFH